MNYAEIVLIPQFRSVGRGVTVNYEAKALYTASREQIASQFQEELQGLVGDRGRSFRRAFVDRLLAGISTDDDDDPVADSARAGVGPGTISARGKDRESAVAAHLGKAQFRELVFGARPVEVGLVEERRPGKLEDAVRFELPE